MTCDVVPIPGGGTAIVCSSRRRQRCACGQPATRLCDWRVPEKKGGTCDAPLCTRCRKSPATGKDLCPTHAAAFTTWQAQRTPQLPFEPRA